MITTYLFSWEFWRNIGMLFVGSCVLGFMLYMGLKLLIALVTMSGNSTSKSDEDGCAGCFFFPFAFILIYWIGGGVLQTIQAAGWLRFKAEQLTGVEQKITNVANFYKEAPLLFENYNTLKQLEEAESSYVNNTLRRELAQITQKKAKSSLEAKVAQADKDIAVLQNMQRNIEELAVRLYFVRYMQNLNLDVEAEDAALQQAIRQMQTKAERTIDEIEKRIHPKTE